MTDIATGGSGIDGLPVGAAGLLSSLGLPLRGGYSLTGDASARRFYRVRFSGGRTRVLMETGTPFDRRADPFCLTAAFLEQRGLPVPAVTAVDGAAGYVLLEDLGDLTLEHCFRNETPDSLQRRAVLYGEAVRLILGLQGRASRGIPSELPAGRLAFDFEKLYSELEFFHRHCLGDLLEVRISGSEETTIQDFYGDLCRRIAGFRPRVLCHRDFHSRNLMVTRRGLVMVDFQDARLGPDTYDLVSLLRDAYVSPGDELEKRLIRMYRRLGRPGLVDDKRFRNRYESTAAQRNLKAIGTFSHQAAVRGNRRYLSSIPRTLRHLRRAFDALPEYERPAALLYKKMRPLFSGRGVSGINER